MVAVIELEPATQAHVPGIEAMLDDEFIRFTRVPDPVPDGFARSWIERYEAGRADGSREAFAIVEDGEFLGLALAPTVNRETQTAELGYGLAPSARGRGVATEALRLLTDWAFAQGMIRLELLISADNPASQRVAERCGYVLEGVLRNTYVKPGWRTDTQVWSRLATD
jgi:RimJ/RimL family protein N-acetyltransferase